MEEEDWARYSKCRNLTPQQADALFFPGPGGKVNKSEQFCKGCPVLGKCLTESITRKLTGFFAGTTDDERRQMAAFNRMVVTGLEMPPEPVRKRKVYLKIVVNDPYDWLDTVEPELSDIV